MPSAVLLTNELAQKPYDECVLHLCIAYAQFLRIFPDRGLTEGIDLIYAVCTSVDVVHEQGRYFRDYVFVDVLKKLKSTIEEVHA